MPLDPALQLVLDAMAARGAPRIEDQTPEQARADLARLDATLAKFGPRTPVGDVHDETVAGPGGAIAVRVYRPEVPAGPTPTTVMFHGGGYVLGTLDSHDDQARLICRGTAGVVVSVDYRLAPEAPYPGAPDDCEAVTRYVLDHVEDYGGDSTRVGVAGDSAGGGLSIVVALRLLAAPAAAPLAAQLLFYPVADLSDEVANYPSRAANAEGLLLTAPMMRWFGEHYAGSADRTDPDVSPIYASDVSGMAPTVLATAEFDPLRDEGNAFARKLADAGVDVAAYEFDGLIHGFTGLGAQSPASQLATETCVAAYATMLRRDAAAVADPSTRDTVSGGISPS